jgi:hypothetical protein
MRIFSECFRPRRVLRSIGHTGYQGESDKILDPSPHAQHRTCRRNRLKNYVDEEAQRKNTTKLRVMAQAENLYKHRQRLIKLGQMVIASRIPPGSLARSCVENRFMQHALSNRGA